MRKVFFVIFVSGILNGLFAQTSSSVRELNDLLRDGQVILRVNGNGGSSGMVIDGFLRNSNSGELWIDIDIKQGLYLKNSGAGQNMVATQIYLEGGRYSFDGSRNFIVLSPREDAAVSLVAFCANLERDNPSSEESFIRDVMPQELQTMAENINRYMREHPDDENVVVVAQLALWRSQGKTMDEIGEHFLFTQDDWDSAGVLLNY
jgi:hypothetical protein